MPTVTNEITFEIPGEARGKERPRMTKTGIVYTPKQTVNYEALVKQVASTAMENRPPLDGVRITAEITAVRQAPKYLCNKKSTMAKLENGFLLPCMSKPDCDNIAKAILDACNKIVYRDDAMVWSVSVQKVFGLRPHVKVAFSFAEIAK